MEFNEVGWIPLLGYGGKYLIHPELGIVKNKGVYGQTVKYVPSEYKQHIDAIAATPHTEFLVLEDGVEPVKPTSNHRVSLRGHDKVHRNIRLNALVAMHFVPKEIGCKYILHIDGDSANCKADNLMWVNGTLREAEDTKHIEADIKKKMSIQDIAVKHRYRIKVIKAIVEHLQKEEDKAEKEAEKLTLAPLKGYEGYYRISPKGRIYSESRKKYLTAYSNKLTKHLEICLRKRAKIHQDVNVAKLVANTFVENPNKYTYIRFKDGNKLNVCADNLEWVESSYG